MESPRLRPPFTLILVELSVMLLLVGSWLHLLGLMFRTYAGTGGGSLAVPLVPNVRYETVVRGVHSLGEGDEAAARLCEGGKLLQLFDVRPVVLMGVQTLLVLSLLAVALSLHQVLRIVLSVTAQQPFSEANWRRCRWVGVWMLATWLLDVGHRWTLGWLVDSATIDGIANYRLGHLHEHDLTFLALSFCAFAASAVLRYGADLERELTI